MPESATHQKTIGVFDSGFGGLTVLRALLPRIPGAHYVYLGDTARLPYGAKSQTTIARYAVESARFLEAQGCELLVIACNTATALALEDIRRAVQVPVLGVIGPGAQAADRALNGLEDDPRADAMQVLVLATEATVQSHAYRDACDRLGLEAFEFACPLLVPLVEEGWIDHAVTRDVLRIYLDQVFRKGSPQVVLLGCTHYPLLRPAITRILGELGSKALVIDSAEAMAEAVSAAIGPISAVEVFPAPGDALQTNATAASFECFATDSVEKFRRLGSLFLQQPIREVHHLDLGG